MGSEMCIRDRQVAASEQRAREQEQEAAERISRAEREADERCRTLRNHAEDIVRDLQARMKAMEATALSAGEQEKIELKSELQGLKLEERSEETQAQALVSKSELLQEEFTKERDNLVNQLQTRLMVERERVWSCTGRGSPKRRQHTKLKSSSRCRDRDSAMKQKKRSRTLNA